MSGYISIGDKKEQQRRLRSKVLEIGGWLKYHLKDLIGDIEARNTIIKKPIGIWGVVDSCLIIGAREGIKKGGTLSKGDYY